MRGTIRKMVLAVFLLGAAYVTSTPVHATNGCQYEMFVCEAGGYGGGFYIHYCHPDTNGQLYCYFSCVAGGEVIWGPDWCRYDF